MREMTETEEKRIVEKEMERLKNEGKITVTYGMFELMVEHGFKYDMDDVDIKLREQRVIIEHL